MKKFFSIVGCGRVGNALAIQLSKAGYKCSGISSKSIESAKKTAISIKAKKYTIHPWEVTDGADFIFITTPDSTIAEVCDNISSHKGFSERNIIFHCSGSLPSTILNSAKKFNAKIGSLHPLQSFASIDPNINPFKGIICAIEGDDIAVNTGKHIIKDLESLCYVIETQGKTLYHASAVVASNYLVSLMDMALKLMEKAGLKKDEAFNVLKPLILGTLNNIEKNGTIKALTGPIARGDINIVIKHINDINSFVPELSFFYKVLGLYTVDLAKNNMISDEIAKKFKELLL
ncbi:MAG: DUF2520 domain-containing protein [Desulfobacterales bacterium]|nr:DUF2520 domain-containing protein [Desulfobacterales bacterium]